MTETWSKFSAFERLFADEAVPNNPVVITACLTLSENPSETWLYSSLLPRILAHPRFSARMVRRSTRYPYFESVPGFTAESELLKQYHVALEPVIDLSLPHDKRNKLFQSRLSEIMSEDLDRYRPLWRLFFFPCWSIEASSCQEQSSTLVFRIHHTVADGIGLVKYLMSEVIDDNTGSNVKHLTTPHRHAQEAGKHAGVRCEARLTKKSRWFPALQDFAANLKTVFGTLRPESDNAFVRSRLGGQKVCALLPPTMYTVDILKKAARALGITINDLFYTAVSGAVRAYLKECGDDPNVLKGVRCGIPFTKHMVDEFRTTDVSNQLAMVTVPLHIHIDDRKDRLVECTHTMNVTKTGFAPGLVLTLLGVIARLPAFIRKPLWRLLTKSGSCLFTNVPGPRKEVSIGGIKIACIHFFAPADGHCGVIIALHSYNGKITSSVYGDKTRISDPQRLVELLNNEVSELIKLSDVQ
ncbi:hypothetical protein BWQ96_04356 [Gracilariopsis chorda]|uniref:Uncharacterized protein n=1 Tax=Gracilariopsis chorda TaxID=448386 RepID=A0A2V3IUX9_9FLOR|nr:hypothetical protein BWQ96_04356 [Gracilariopsis chorda]|eukprot:PXF45921.1 hypothetical protein BWQ96_04356 [Gracilariopsis chorda]